MNIEEYIKELLTIIAEQKAEIKRLKAMLGATLAGQSTLRQRIKELEAQQK